MIQKKNSSLLKCPTLLSEQWTVGKDMPLGRDFNQNLSAKNLSDLISAFLVELPASLDLALVLVVLAELVYDLPVGVRVLLLWVHVREDLARVVEALAVVLPHFPHRVLVLEAEVDGLLVRLSLGSLSFAENALVDSHHAVRRVVLWFNLKNYTLKTRWKY